MSTAQEEPRVQVRRYSGMARINHWTVAITFMLLMVSGAALFYPSFFPLTALFGGGQMTRWLHPWLGLVLAVAYMGLFVRFFWQNLPEFTDFVWMARIKDVLRGHEENLPEVGKYNAGQKFVFWAQFVLIAVMLVTGLGLWDQGLIFMDQTLGFKASIEQRRWAALIHACAAILTITIWVIHVYAAIWVRGTMGAMISGFVSGGWGWRHHRKWLRKEVKVGKVSPAE